MSRIAWGRRGPIVILALVASASLGLAACGNGTGDDAANGTGGAAMASSDSSTSTTSTASNPAATYAPPSSLASTVPTSTTTSVPATTTSTSTPSSTTTSAQAAAGTPFTIGPLAGEEMDVVGVAYNDVLNFRTSPDPAASVVATATPLASAPDIVSKGSGLLPNGGGAWWNVTVDGVDAWANVSYLGALPATETSIMSDLTTAMPAITAPDAQTLAANVTKARGGSNPTFVFSAEPLAVDAQSGEATIDVIGMDDDALKGERIKLAFQFVWDNSDPANPVLTEVALTEAIMTPICSRGVTNTLCR